MRSLAAATLLAVASLPTSAYASYRNYVWTYSNAVGADGDAGVETWVTNFLNDMRRPQQQGWAIWWGGTATLNDRLELGIFAVTGGPASALQTFSGLHTQLRLRLSDNFGAVADLVVGDHGRADEVSGGGYLVGRVERGAFDFTANLGTTYDYSGPDLEIYGATAASYQLTELLRVTAEAFIHYFPGGEVARPYVLYAGPGLALVKGRFWADVNVGFGPAFGVTSGCSRLILGVQL